MFKDRGFRGEHFFRGPWRGGPWRESPFQKGDLKYVVLGLLKDKPRYGYEVIRALEERSHGFYTPSPGVVYPTLQMLKEMGYASSIERDGKKVYTITDKGLKFLTERKDQAEEVKCQMKHHWNPANMNMIVQMMREFGELGRLMKHHGRRTDPEKMQRIRDIMSKASQDIKLIMDE